MPAIGYHIQNCSRFKHAKIIAQNLQGRAKPNKNKTKQNQNKTKTKIILYPQRISQKAVTLEYHITGSECDLNFLSTFNGRGIRKR